MKGKILSSLAALLLLSGSITAFVGSANTPNVLAAEQSASKQLSTVTIRQDGNALTSSYDGGNTWSLFLSEEVHDFYSYNEFQSWIKEQEAEISKLVEAGEWTRENADAAIQQYYDLLGKVDNGLLVSKRESDTDDQYFVSYPETAHTEGFQTMIYTENGYEFFGPYDTEKELYEDLEAYAELQVEEGNMTTGEAENILKKYK